ncbi:neuropeptide FF receptor 1-like [Acropora palmata]|uniref:neuropeptide FF receptor 1-like n=1 Tax=Acropora palmata TaxID=6131 RepID=UPI003DA0DC09
MADVNHNSTNTSQLDRLNLFNSDALTVLTRSSSLKEAPVSFGVVLAMGILLILLGIAVNATICFVMLQRKRYKKNNSNFFILHLSVTELVIRLLIFPLVVYSLTVLSGMNTLQCKLLTSLTTILGSSIFVTLVAIAFDRYQNIADPMMTFKSRRRPVQAVLLVWLYSMVMSIPSSISVRSISVKDLPESNGKDCRNCQEKTCLIPQDTLGQFSSIWYFIFAFFVPLLVIFTLYAKIATLLRQRDIDGAFHKVATRSKSKAIRMLIATVFGYFFSFGPDVVFNVMRSYGFFKNTSFTVTFLSVTIVELSMYTSSLINPLIYAYYNRAFRRELQILLCMKCSYDRNKSAPNIVNIKLD